MSHPFQDLYGEVAAALVVEQPRDLATINYCQQGTSTLCSEEALRAREANRTDPGVVEAIREWWSWLPKAQTIINTVPASAPSPGPAPLQLSPSPPPPPQQQLLTSQTQQPDDPAAVEEDELEHQLLGPAFADGSSGDGTGQQTPPLLSGRVMQLREGSGGDAAAEGMVAADGGGNNLSGGTGAADGWSGEASLGCAAVLDEPIYLATVVLITWVRGMGCGRVKLNTNAARAGN